MHESEKSKWRHSVVSDSQRPRGLQPTRLLHPWDFPGKSTGVGCHCLLWRICLQCRKYRRCGFNPRSERSPGGGHGKPLQYSCPDNPMDRWATVHRVPKSWTQLKWLSTHTYNWFTSLQKLTQHCKATILPQKIKKKKQKTKQTRTKAKYIKSENENS